MAIASGQITIIDLTDEVSLQGFLTSSQPKIQFSDANGNSHNPNWASVKPVITSEIYRMGTANNLITDTTVIKGVRWYYKLSGETTYTLVASDNANYTIASNKSTLTINTNLMTKAKPSLSIRCEVDYKHNESFPINTYKIDLEYSLAVQGNTGNTGAQGQTGMTALLTNESTSIVCNSGGTPTDSTLAATSSGIEVYQGATKLTAVPSANTPSSTQFKYAIGTGVGCVGARVNDSTFKLSSVSADSGTLPITITTSTQTLTKVFSFTKTKAGTNGSNGATGAAAKSVDLSATSQIISYNEGGTPSHASVKMTATKQNISSTTYAWAYSTDGTTFTTISGQTGAELTVAHNVSYFTTKSITFKVTIDGQFDTITISKVSDGTTPILSYSWCPDGMVFKNANANDSLKAIMELTKNGTSVSGSSYQWYYQNSAGTDDQAIVGAGWTKCVDKTNEFAGVTTKQLTLYASQVLGVETFKCKAVYGGKNYFDTATFTDQTDPYQVELISTAGTIFKNGVGSTQVTCKLYQNGLEIDSAGTGYTYNWIKRDKNGNVTSPNPFKTGKTITITASDIAEKGTFDCEILKK